MHTLCLVNTLNMINSFTYSNHVAFWTKTKELYPSRDGHKFDFFTPPRMSIDMARNTAAREAIRRECDYLLFIDDDVLVPDTAFDSLVKCNSDIAAGLVIIRGYPFHVMAFKKEEGSFPYFDDLPTVEGILKDPVTHDDGLAATGFSCCLIKVSLLLKVPPPYFITGPRNTEDIYFCLKARDTIEELNKNGHNLSPLTISMATHVQCGHFLHPEPIEWRTIDIFKQFYEDLFPDLYSQVENGTYKRDEEYIKRSLSQL